MPDTYTPNLNLKKPGYDSPADIKDLNDNFDKIDNSVGQLSQQMVNYRTADNLLDNSDFEIARAGYGGYHGSVIYAADRWAQNDSTARTYTKVTHNGHGALKCTSDTRIQQKLYLTDGMPYTAAFLINDRLYLYAFTANKGSNGSGNVWVNYQSDGTYMFVISGVPANGIISEPVLYPGTYTAETLPPYAPKGYAAELAACNVADTGCVERTLIHENTTYVATGFPANPTTASNTVYTTPADGIFYLFATRGETAGNTIRVYILKPSGKTVAQFNIPAYYPYAMCCLTIPVKRGMEIKVDADSASATWMIREQKFFY